MTIRTRITHVGFSDESNWNIGRFRSLGLVTCSVSRTNQFETHLRKVLDGLGITEFKWTNLRGSKERSAALRMCDFAVSAACRGELRIDVLIWDIMDNRHAIRGRDNIANLQRMYYHLFRNVLRARWPDHAIWRLYPDEHTAMDWGTIEDCLGNVAERPEEGTSLFTPGGFRLRLHRVFSVEAIQSATSSDKPLLQLADLFAGMAVFSREKFFEYQHWLSANSSQKSLFDDEIACLKLSRSASERFPVLKAFDESCKARRLGVSLETKGGLWTPDPRNPLNFWMYEPQHPEDRAPTKRRE